MQCWGWIDLYGTVASAREVAGGGSHACALRSDGPVACWGDNNYGQLGIGSFEPVSGPTETL